MIETVINKYTKNINKNFGNILNAFLIPNLNLFIFVISLYFGFYALHILLPVQNYVLQQ